MSFSGRLTGRPKTDSNTGHGSGAGVSFGLQPTWNVVGRRKLLASEPQTERITTLHHSTWVSADDTDSAVLHDCIMNCMLSCLYWILYVRTLYHILLLSCHFCKNNFCWVMKHIGTVVSKFRFYVILFPQLENHQRSGWVPGKWVIWQNSSKKIHFYFSVYGCNWNFVFQMSSALAYNCQTINWSIFLLIFPTGLW
jgi:hypothetical protein